jgi:hypothetical protein
MPGNRSCERCRLLSARKEPAPHVQQSGKRLCSLPSVSIIHCTIRIARSISLYSRSLSYFRRLHLTIRNDFQPRRSQFAGAGSQRFGDSVAKLYSAKQCWHSYCPVPVFFSFAIASRDAIAWNRYHQSAPPFVSCPATSARYLVVPVFNNFSTADCCARNAF